MTPIELATELAQQAGAVLMSRLGQPHEIREKSRRADLVTEADHASEAIILERVRKEFPGATILAEESGTHRGSNRERWIVDPLDGTTNFAHGYPLFCVSIGYERDGEMVAGVIYAPALDECFAAERGAGATMNGNPIHVSAIETLGEAMTCTGFHPADFERNAACFRSVSHRAQAVRRDGSAALDLGFLACGRFDGFWEFDLSPWDVAAGTLIVREAGGRVSRIDGGPAALDARQILATNGHIHGELCEALASS
jgi:myo-inositol-1(or 4)-monophosphatase